MTRIKTFNSTGLPPDGKLYSGDLNAMQDHYADLSNFSQTVDMQVLRFGATDLQLLRFGAGAGGITSEARLTGSLRADGVIRGLGGFIAGTFTTTTRDAIASGGAPYGVIILNSQTNQYEWNNGTDGARTWLPLAGLLDGSVTLAKLAANSVDSSKIVDATIVNADIAVAAAIAYSKLNLASQIVNNDIAAGAAIAYSKLSLALSIATGDIVAQAVTAAKIANNTITATQIANDTITATQIAADAIGASELANSAVDTAAIANGNVTDVKLASVFAKALAANMHIEGGIVGDARFVPHITFAQAFASAPAVVVTLESPGTGGTNAVALVSNVSSTGFDLNTAAWYGGGEDNPFKAYWIAFGA